MKVLALILLFAASVARAEPSIERNPLDLAVKFGVATGPATQADKSIGKYGGFPIAAGLDFNLSRKFTLEVALDFAADFANFQVTRIGLGVQLAYHLLGGARRVVTDYGNSLIVTRDAYNVSVVLRQAVEQYTVPGKVAIPDSGTTTTDDTTTPKATIGGAVLATHLGAEGRFDLTDSVSFSLTVYLPIFALPASSDRIKATVTEVVGSLRFFL